jgi:hypothetical protein
VSKLTEREVSAKIAKLQEEIHAKIGEIEVLADGAGIQVYMDFGPSNSSWGPGGYTYTPRNWQSSSSDCGDTDLDAVPGRWVSSSENC